MSKFFLLLLWPLLAFADTTMVFRHEADWIRVTARPCSNEAVQVRIHLVGKNPLDFRHAQAFISGKLFEACWTPDYTEVAVILIYEDGDQGILSRQQFKPENDI